MSYPERTKEIANQLLEKLILKLDLNEKVAQLPSNDFRKSDIYQVIGDLETNLNISKTINKFNSEAVIENQDSNQKEAADNLRALIAAENKSQNLEQ
jgi:hypothetical protein